MTRIEVRREVRSQCQAKPQGLTLRATDTKER
jgi:hypothetical protein